MRKDKRFLFTQRGIKFLIQIKGVLVYKFIFSFARVHIRQTVFGNKAVQDIVFYPDKITPDIGRLDRQPINVTVIIQGGDRSGLVDFKKRDDV